MNRKMTLFALAGKWPFFGASGSASGTAAEARPSWKSDAGATEPRPRAQSRKKWRRVRSSSGSSDMGLFSGDELVQVEQHARHAGPGRPVRRGGLALAPEQAEQ